jgi:hypothetical protein
MEIFLRILGALVGAAFIAMSVQALISPLGDDSLWATMGKSFAIILGLTFLLYGQLGRRRFKLLIRWLLRNRG